MAILAADREHVFAALCANGLEFIERSAKELPDQKKFSIAHFATGLELILKARLFAEHWSLIAVNPHDCNWSAVKSGTVKTIAAADLCSAISSVTGESLHHEQDHFKRAFVHRNKVLHWLPDDNLVAVTAEQCRAWYALHRLLTGRWLKVFKNVAADVQRVETSLRVHHAYLQTRFEAVAPRLRGLLAGGRIAACCVCGFDSAELEEPQLQVSAFDCSVCETEGSLARFTCGNWLALLELPSECDCGEEHTKLELEALIDPPKQLSPKDQLSEPDQPCCGECFEWNPTVVPFNDGYLCLDCGSAFDSDSWSSCDHCGTNWVGLNTEDSSFVGCEMCEGPDHRDD